MSTLTIISKALAYDDVSGSSNPSNVAVNWARTIQNLEVRNATTEMATLAAYETRTLIDGQRTLGLDGTTAVALASSSLDPSRYRLSHTGGTDPVFRTKRTLLGVGAGLQVNMVLNANLSMTVTAPVSTTAFTNVQVGDVVFLPGVSTGDAATVFNALNCGYWSVLTRSNGSITMARASDEVFEGITQSVTTLSPLTDFQVYSSAGVQVGDVVELGSAFASTAQGAYSVVAATQGFLEFISTEPLGAESGILPGTLLVYSSSKRFLQVEADQECVLRVNGDLGNTNLIQPWIAGTKTHAAEFRKVGPSWKLVVINKSSAPLKLTVISAE